MKAKIITACLAAVGAGAMLTIAHAQAPAAPAGAPAAARPAFDPNAKPRVQGQNVNGMHIYLYGGLKSHGEGQHDYPQWLADWSKILTEHGAVVDGAFHAPSADDLKNVDVLVIYKGDAGYWSPTEKAAIDAFVKRGGGVVSFHDSLCGPNPAEMAAIVGGGKKHGQVNYTLEANVPYTVVDKDNPIMAGVTDFSIWDEAFYSMTWAPPPGIHVLATAKIPDTPSARRGEGGSHVGEVAPQIWTYEHTVAGGQPSRAFVWMQGHTYANFVDPRVEPILLRGIAWAGKKPVNELTDYKAPPAPPRPAAPAAPAR